MGSLPSSLAAGNLPGFVAHCTYFPSQCEAHLLGFFLYIIVVVVLNRFCIFFVNLLHLPLADLLP